MAQPSTTYKFELNLTTSTSVYESVKQTIARTLRKPKSA